MRKQYFPVLPVHKSESPASTATMYSFLQVYLQVVTSFDMTCRLCPKSVT